MHIVYNQKMCMDFGAEKQTAQAGNKSMDSQLLGNENVANKQSKGCTRMRMIGETDIRPTFSVSDDVRENCNVVLRNCSHLHCKCANVY